MKYLSSHIHKLSNKEILETFLFIHRAFCITYDKYILLYPNDPYSKHLYRMHKKFYEFQLCIRRLEINHLGIIVLEMSKDEFFNLIKDDPLYIHDAESFYLLDGTTDLTNLKYQIK